MLHTIMFTKVSGAGNDFVLIDNMKGELDVDKSRLAVVLCSRNFGVGADGLIVLEPSRNSSFFMLNYNADGSHGGMSGNGGRCAARYAFLNGIAGITMRFESLSHMYEADVIGANVRLKMKEPAHQRFDLTVDVCGQSFICHCIDTGSPHVVIFDPDAESRDVQGVGRAVREHRMFAPKGANVNFVKITADDSLLVRTYELGVEKETLSSGTGTVAAALVAHLQHGLASPIHLRSRSEEDLIVTFAHRGNQLSDVYLEGSAYMLFSGSLSYDSAQGSIVSSFDEPVPVYTSNAQ